MGKGIELEGIALDEEGRVILSDHDLERACADHDLTTAGGTINNTYCTNNANCAGSINNSSCTNASGACVGSTNGHACTSKEMGGD